MAHKYNKINKAQILALFAEKEKINRSYIAKKYNCSIYTARKHLEELQDDGIIKISNHGFIRIIF